MKYIKKRKIFIPIVMASLVTTLGMGPIGLTEQARAESIIKTTSSLNTKEDTNESLVGNKNGFGKGRGQGASGTVTAINGSILTISGKNGVVYAVDASSATLLKRPNLTNSKGVIVPGVPSAITLADIKTGDTVMVRGTVSGTTIKAVKIVDGKTKEKSGLITHSNKNPKNLGRFTIKK